MIALYDKPARTGATYMKSAQKCAAQWSNAGAKSSSVLAESVTTGVMMWQPTSVRRRSQRDGEAAARCGAVCARAPVRESGDEQRAARTVPPPDVLHRRHRAPLEQDALPTAC